MAKKGFTPEQIINKLREAELLLNQGATIAVVSKKIGVSDYTYYRWRKEIRCTKLSVYLRSLRFLWKSCG
jgi:transposase-like protein